MRWLTLLYEFKFLCVVLIVFVLFIIWLNRKQKTTKKREITSICTLPFLKLLFSIWNSKPDHKMGVYLIEGLNSICCVYLKDKLIKGSWAGHTYVMFFHPDVAQEVLKSYSVINKDWLYNILHSWLGTGLLTSSDEKWRNRRKLLTPAFHFRILEDFQEIFYEKSTVLVEILNNTKKNETVEMSKLATLCTLDILAESAMGIQINAQLDHDDVYVKAVKDITSSLIEWFMKPWYWIPPVFRFSRLGKKMRKDIELVHDFTRKVIRNRKDTLIEKLEDEQSIDDFQEEKEVLGIKKRRAFLDLLLYHHLTDNSLTEEDIREEVDTFMFEGHDTTGMGVTWTLYLLGLHLDIQERVFQELRGIFSGDLNRDIKIDDLKMMKYLERVIKESLRLYPSVPYILRRNSEELKIGDYTIPRNSSLVVYIYGMHHNPDVFENPEEFDPDRFLRKNCESRHPFAYVPFSAGPRNCIGQRFAMNVMKTICANVLRKFKIWSTEQRDKVLISGDVILRPEKEIQMLIEKR